MLAISLAAPKSAFYRHIAGAPSANSKLYYERMIYVSMCHFQFFGRLGAPLLLWLPLGIRLPYQRIIHASMCIFLFPAS